MTERPEITDEADLLAAEFALGFLEGEALLAARHRYDDDPAFARAVAQWQQMGSDWSHEFARDQDWRPDALLPRIEAAIGGSGHPVAREAANDAGPARSGWRFGALAASLAAVVLGGLWLQERQGSAELGTQIAALSQDRPANTDRLHVAQLNGADAGPLLTAVYDDTAGQLTVRIATIPPGDLVPELWVIGPDGRPRSLGQSTANSTVVLDLSPQMRADIAAGSAIALSLEPEADTPHEQPTAETVLGAAPLAPLT